MTPVKIVTVLVLLYAGLVATFETVLGRFQPTSDGTVVIATTDADGESYDRVVSRLESDGQLYIAANHWPRAWYSRALANPRVSITSDGETRSYLAVPVSGEEHRRVGREHPIGLVGRILMGFPPRRFVRFEPLVEDDDRAGPTTGQVFTYSRVDTTSETDTVSRVVESDLIPMMAEMGATPYAVWLPVVLAEDAPFAGLSMAQLVLMLAWPEREPPLESLDAAIVALDGVVAVDTQTLTSIYLADGLRVPTGQGFYVHREERYRAEDVDEAVRLSTEAWETWEPAWGTRVTGLYRERPDSSGVVTLLRIVWYEDQPHWLATRQNDDTESRDRFRARRQLQVEGSGVAIATDRAVS